MPRKPKNEASAQEQGLDGFAQQVEQALEHYADPEWLGAHCVLAAPFVLGQHAVKLEALESAQDRGRALREVIVRVAQQLAEESRSFIADLYFQRNQHFTNAGRAMKRHMSERTFYRRRQQAIKELADAIFAVLLPVVRLEHPQARPMAGRTSLVQACTQALRAHRAVCLRGAAGVGKSTVGAHIAAQWQPPCFWFTVRPGVTDRANSFVFALAYALRGWGAAATWRQLLADKGVIEYAQVLSLLRYDLGMLKAGPVLLCIDDVDQLAAEHTDHARLLHLLDELRNHACLLLMGQHVTLETDVVFTLSAFDEDEFAAWLAMAELAHLGAPELELLRSCTRRHPALLTIVANLHRFGEDLASVAIAPGVVPLESLMARIWRRLNELERQILMEVSVYGAAAPKDNWNQVHEAVAALVERSLLLVDQQGGIECDSHVKPLILARMPPDLRRALHARAAAVLEERGEYISAMDQYLHGQQPARAVWLWFIHRVQLTDRGLGPAALAVLTRVAEADLADERDRATLALARAELAALVGQAETTTAASFAFQLEGYSLAGAYAQQLLADAMERRGEIEQSLATYRQALDKLTGSLPLRQVSLHQRLSYLYLARLSDVPAARREAMLALFHSETFAANVEEWTGDLHSARDRYTRALEIANRLDDNLGLLAQGYSYLGKLLLKTGEIDAAINHMQRALQCSEQRGDMVGPLYDRINLSYAFTCQNRCAEALALAAEGLAVAERMGHAYLIAGLAAAAGDAAQRLHDMEAAERYAACSLQQEEPFFRPWALTIYGQLLAARQRLPEAKRALKEAISSASRQEDPYSEAYALEALGSVHLAAGEPAAVRAHWSRALELYRASGFATEESRLRQVLLELG